MVSVPQKIEMVQRWDLGLVAGFFFSFLTTEEINQFSCACLACALNKISDPISLRCLPNHFSEIFCQMVLFLFCGIRYSQTIVRPFTRLRVAS